MKAHVRECHKVLTSHTHDPMSQYHLQNPIIYISNSPEIAWIHISKHHNIVFTYQNTSGTPVVHIFYQNYLVRC